MVRYGVARWGDPGTSRCVGRQTQAAVDRPSSCRPSETGRQSGPAHPGPHLRARLLEFGAQQLRPGTASQPEPGLRDSSVRTHITGLAREAAVAFRLASRGLTIETRLADAQSGPRQPDPTLRPFDANA